MHRRLFELARDTRFGLSATILAGVITGFLTIWQAFSLSGIIERVFLGQQTLPAVADALGLLLAIIVLRALFTWAGSFAASTVAVQIKSRLRARLFAHLLRLGPAFAHGERTGELANAAVEGVEALDAYFSQYLPQLFISALIPLLILMMVFPLDPLSGLVLLLTAPLIPLFMILIGKAAGVLATRQFETLGRLSAHFLDSLQGLTTLKLFGRSQAHVKTVEEVNERFRDTTLRVLRIAFLSALALELIATLSTAIVAVEVGIRLLYGQMEFRQALFLLVVAPEFYIPLRVLGQRYHAGMSGVTAAKRIFEILDTKASDQLPVVSLPQMCWGGLPSIDFEHVAFTYPGQEKPALQDITLQIESGQRIALVGPSGAGKSTLASLLLRFIEPEQGRLMLNGAPLRSIDPDEWRRQIAWVPQKPYLFHDTIAANIRLGRPDASEGELIAAAQAAHLHTFIRSLPDGYNTLVGEAGARLSGGEAQRLALARAFLKDAPILILDEPTSSLDPRSETLLEDSIRRLVQSRTVITIAHRLNTVFRADRIVVLAEGRIVESGTHRELLAGNRLYASLVAAHAGHDDWPGQAGNSADYADTFITEDDLASTAGNQPARATDRPSSIVHRPLSTVLRLTGFLRGAWARVAGSVLLGAATIGSSVALMGTSAYLISSAALHPSIAELALAIVGVRFFGIARGVFRYFERLVSHNVTFRLLARLRTWFYMALEPLAPARLMQYRSGDLLSRVVADVETLENFYVRVVSPPLVAVLVAAGSALFLGAYDPVLGWTLLGSLFILGAVIPFVNEVLGRRLGRELVARRADLHVQLVDGVQGLADLIAFGRQADRSRQIESTGRAYARLQQRLGLAAGFNDGLGVLFTHLGMWLVLSLAIPRVIAGEIPGVMLAALGLIAAASFEAVVPLPLAAQMLGGSLEAARRLFDVVDAQPAVSDPPAVREPGAEPASAAVAFQGVSFSYGGVQVLNGINFQIRAGEAVAIVGPSGAGKSTLVNLLARFWDYEHGDILLAGRSIRSMAQDDVRRRLAVVAQNAHFFNATIRQNLALANPQATQAQLEAAARQAQIHDFIMGLPKGYETWIGEQGLRLSGGERQRLAIARALLKDSPVLVLDEPTANLDPLTEQAILQALFAAAQGRTTLMITHRLVGLERFDKILVFEHGLIVESGSHRDLLARDGLYRQMWLLQNRILGEQLPAQPIKV
jgi:ATP-binding cassette subfamily C protein CydCD